MRLTLRWAFLDYSPSPSGQALILSGRHFIFERVLAQAGIRVANQVDTRFQPKFAKQLLRGTFNQIAKGGEQALFSSEFNPQTNDNN